MEPSIKWVNDAGILQQSMSAHLKTVLLPYLLQSVWDLAGKRSIVRQLAGSSRVNTTNLMMVNSCADVYIASQSMDLAILETTGQFIFGKLRPIGRLSARSAHGLYSAKQPTNWFNICGSVPCTWPLQVTPLLEGSDTKQTL
jgi:hypothetical protein